MKFKFDSSFRWNEGTRVLLEGPSSGPCHWSMARLSIEEALDMNIHSKQLRSLNSYQVTVDRPIPFVFLLFFFFCFWETRFWFCFLFFTQSNPVSSRWPFFIYRVLRRFDWIVMRFTGLRLIFYGSSAILCGIYRVLTRWTRWNFNFGSAAFPFTSSSSSVSSRPPLPPTIRVIRGPFWGFFFCHFLLLFFCFVFFFNLGKVVASTFWVSVF